MIELFYDLDHTVQQTWHTSVARTTVAGWLVEFIEPSGYSIVTRPKVNEHNTLECYQMRIRFHGSQAKRNAMRFKLSYSGVSPLR